MKSTSLFSLRRLITQLVIAAAMIPVCSIPALAEVHVIISGGFSGAYRQVLPEFEKTTGIKVITGSGASQGTGPQTVAAQLQRGVPADVVILSREGLADLIAAGRIIAGTDVDLARVPLGVAVRAGAGKPDVSTVAALKRTLLNAKTVAVPGSTSGIYLTSKLFPQLGIADQISVTVTERGAQSAKMVATGEANIAVQPVSELVNVPGIDFAGRLPDEVQLVQVFVAAIVTGSKQPDAARRLIQFLASERAAPAIEKNGMELIRKRAVSCIGCATFDPSTNEQNARPDDFGVQYEWREGSLPPPYHYRYTVIIRPSGQSEIVLTPDYLSITVPKWTEFFKVDEQGLNDLYRVMVENGLFTKKWRQLDAAPVGGSNQTLVVTAQGKRIKVEDYLVPEQQVPAKAMYAAVQALVPKDIRELLQARRQQYMQEQRRK
jgi:molybdate transport system substrate-binding protein